MATEGNMRSSETVFDLLEKAVGAERRRLAKLRNEGQIDGIEIVEGIEQWAIKALGTARNLTQIEDVHSLQIGEMAIPVSDLSKMAAGFLIAPYWQLKVAQEACERARGVGSRVLEVLELSLKTKLNPIAQDYRQRVAGLYLWGFDNEAFALTRSTLDAALFDRLESHGGDEMVERRLQYNKSKRKADLVGRIKVAGPSHLKILSARTCQLAHDIRNDGNGVLHTTAQHHLKHSNALEAIRSLGAVLSELFP